MTQNILLGAYVQTAAGKNTYRPCLVDDSLKWTAKQTQKESVSLSPKLTAVELQLRSDTATAARCLNYEEACDTMPVPPGSRVTGGFVVRRTGYGRGMVEVRTGITTTQ